MHSCPWEPGPNVKRLLEWITNACLAGYSLASVQPSLSEIPWLVTVISGLNSAAPAAPMAAAEVPRLQPETTAHAARLRKRENSKAEMLAELAASSGKRAGAAEDCCAWREYCQDCSADGVPRRRGKQ